MSILNNDGVEAIHFEASFQDENLIAKTPNFEVSKRDLFEENIASSFKSQLSNSGLLPSGCLYADKTGKLVMFERPPRYQQITYYPESRQDAIESEEDRSRTFMIPLPWQIYIAEYQSSGKLFSIKMFFSDSEVNQLSNVSGTNEFYISNLNKTPLRVPTLPNIYGNYNFCIDNEVIYAQDHTLEAKIFGAYNAVWDTVFNNDLLDTYSPGIDQATSFLANKKSRNYSIDPFNFFKDWADFSIGELLNSMKMFISIKDNFTAEIVDLTSTEDSTFNNIVNILPQLV